MLCQAATWTGMNGLGLALVMPCAQSIMAEVFSAKERGRAFGTLFTLSAVGERLSPELQPGCFQMLGFQHHCAQDLAASAVTSGKPAAVQRWLI